MKRRRAKIRQSLTRRPGGSVQAYYSRIASQNLRLIELNSDFIYEHGKTINPAKKRRKMDKRFIGPDARFRAALRA